MLELDISRHTREGYKLGSYPGFQAEIRRGADVGWHAIICVPGQERIAAAHLVGRRFGIYFPEIEIIEKGKRLHEGMFPGYLFVWVWDIAYHWDRICQCPGVIGILAPIEDNILKEVQIIENEKRPLVSNLKKKKRWRREKIEEEPGLDNEIVSIRMRSALHDVQGLDREARSSLLRKALGLA